MASKSASKTFKNVSVHDLMNWIDVKSPADFDDNPSLYDYLGEASSSFVREWATDEFDLNEVEFDEIAEAVNQDVDMTIQENVETNTFKQCLRAVEHALEQSMEEARIDNTVVSNEKKGTLTIIVDAKDLMRAWAEETEGVGLVAWDPSLTIKDIETARTLVSILDHRAEVYGYRDLEHTFNDHFDRWEPDTGSYQELAKVAQEAWKRHLREKHAAGTKHRK